MGTTSTTLFTGSSSYAKDFSNVVSRAVAIASLPIDQLTTEKTSLSGQSAAIETIEQKVAAIQTAIQEIGDALTSSFDVSSSATSVLTATAGAGATEGNYSVLVSDAGAYSTMMTRTWSAASDPAHTFKLCIGTSEFDVAPVDNSAAAVAAAINKTYGGKVHATVVNVGPQDAPDYRISMQSVGLTTDLLDLKDGASLQETQTAGKPAKYQVNGSGITVTSNTRNVTIAKGVTLSLKSSSLDAANVTVTRSTSALNDALGRLVETYNDAVTELDAQHGDTGGALQGNSLVSQIAGVLSGVSTYSSGGAVSGLRDIGIELGKDGFLTQNTFELLAMDLSNPAGVTSFFEEFLEDAGKALDGLLNTTQGTITAAQADTASQLTKLTRTIEEKQAAVEDLQLRLINQMAQADALLASLEQQYSYMSSMFSAMRASAEQNR